MYAWMQIFIQLSPTTTKLCYIMCDHPAYVSVDGGHFGHIMVVALKFQGGGIFLTHTVYKVGLHNTLSICIIRPICIQLCPTFVSGRLSAVDEFSNQSNKKTSNNQNF